MLGLLLINSLIGGWTTLIVGVLCRLFFAKNYYIAFSIQLITKNPSDDGINWIYISMGTANVNLDYEWCLFWSHEIRKYGGWCEGIEANTNGEAGWCWAAYGSGAHRVGERLQVNLRVSNRRRLFWEEEGHLTPGRKADQLASTCLQFKHTLVSFTRLKRVGVVGLMELKKQGYSLKYDGSIYFVHAF